MKVIRGETLNRLLSNVELECDHLEPGLKKEVIITSLKSCLKSLIDDYLEEIDTLTVSKLRPMCDAPRDGESIFCVLNGSVNLREMYFKHDIWWLEGTDMCLSDSNIQGWVPKTIYKPELT